MRRSSRSCARSQYRSSSSCATSKKEELVARLGDALSNAEQPVEKRNFSKAEVLKMLDLPEMQNLLCQKRLRWVGHALRRKDGDLPKDTVMQELARKSSTWTACVLSDVEALSIGGVVASEREASDRESALAASRYIVTVVWREPSRNLGLGFSSVPPASKMQPRASAAWNVRQLCWLERAMGRAQCNYTACSRGLPRHNRNR